MVQQLGAMRSWKLRVRGPTIGSGRGPTIGSSGEEEGRREERGGRASKESMDKFRRWFVEENIEEFFFSNSYVSIFSASKSGTFQNLEVRFISSLWV